MKKTLVMIFFWILLFLPFSIQAQKNDDSSLAIRSQPSEHMEKDSTKVIEDAPLDIGQNRGLFIITPDRKLQMRILGSVRFLIVFDNILMENKNSWGTFVIPTGNQNQSLPNYYNGLEQSRLGFEVTRSTDKGNVFVRIETDFAGPNGFRLRHAYGQYRTLLVGQTWSLFSQITGLPTTVDFSGPTGSVVSRTPQIRYSPVKQVFGMNFATGLEYIIPDQSIPDSLSVQSFQLFPDLTFRLDKTFNKAYFQISGIIPLLSGRNIQGDLLIVSGWGIASSAMINVWKNGKIYIQLVGGQAIARMINDLSGNGLDVIVDPNSGAETPFCMGGYFGYEHKWNKRLFSNFIYSMVETEKLSYTPDNTFHWGYAFRSNTFWKIVEGANLGAEVIWGERINKDLIKGDAFRFNLLFYYDF